MKSLGLRAYLASPLGFSTSSIYYMEKVLVPALKKMGLVVVNPWHLTSDDEFKAVHAMDPGEEKERALSDLFRLVGRRNRLAINLAHIVVAFLDGQEPDSGTVGEVCYAAALHIPVFGLRTDLRQCGERGARFCNIQVEDFIDFSGGKIFGSLEEMQQFAAKYMPLYQLAEE